MTILPALFVFIAPAAAIWLAAFLFLNDLAVRSQSLKGLRRALVIFPHADDEMNVGGLLWRLSQQGTEVTLAVLTKGERGTPDAHPDPHLKTIRAKEAQASCRCLGVSQLIQEDFGDGQLGKRRAKLQPYIDELLARTKPDLIITYDHAGMYGHPDHIACSEIVTDLVRSKYKSTVLWYVAFPKRLLTTVKLPEHMAKDPHFKNKRAVANRKVFIGIHGLAAKTRAVYAHKSQLASFQKAMPYHVPLWLMYSVQLFEYFEEGSKI